MVYLHCESEIFLSDLLLLRVNSKFAPKKKSWGDIASALAFGQCRPTFMVYLRGSLIWGFHRSVFTVHLAYNEWKVAKQIALLKRALCNRNAKLVKEQECIPACWLYPVVWEVSDQGGVCANTPGPEADTPQDQRQTPPPPLWTEWQTLVKTTFANFVCGR